MRNVISMGKVLGEMSNRKNSTFPGSMSVPQGSSKIIRYIPAFVVENIRWKRSQIHPRSLLTATIDARWKMQDFQS